MHVVRALHEMRREGGVMKIIPEGASLIHRRGLDGAVRQPEPEDNRTGTKIINATQQQPVVVQQAPGAFGGLLMMPIDAAKAVYGAAKGRYDDAKKMAKTPVGELK